MLGTEAVVTLGAMRQKALIRRWPMLPARAGHIQKTPGRLQPFSAAAGTGDLIVNLLTQPEPLGSIKMHKNRHRSRGVPASG